MNDDSSIKIGDIVKRRHGKKLYEVLRIIGEFTAVCLPVDVNYPNIDRISLRQLIKIKKERE